MAATILGLGLSHFGGFMFPPEDMAARVRARLADGTLPAALDHPDKWPAPMRAEWGADEGAGFAARHTAEYFAGLDRVRAALDEFDPDAVVIFGDDQYECFREDLVPPYCVFAGASFRSRPYARPRVFGGGVPNIWNDPPDAESEFAGAPAIAGEILHGLTAAGFDPAWSYRLPHQEVLGHAFTNTLMYLDHRRAGFRWPVIPFAINAYGADLIRARGGYVPDGRAADAALAALPAPPAPQPARLFDLGMALAGILGAGDRRVALVGSSSFSHGFLTAKHAYFYPDVDADRARHGELARGDYAAWRRLSLGDLEEAGQHELLNWMPLVGAMHALGRKPAYCALMESWLMNSSKVVAVFPPAS